MDSKPTGQPAYQAHPKKQLFRDTDNKMIGGVCSGIAEYFNLDPTIVRVIAAVLLVAGWGSLGLVYIVLWAVVPERPKVIPMTTVPGQGSPGYGYSNVTPDAGGAATGSSSDDTWSMPQSTVGTNPNVNTPGSNAGGTDGAHHAASTAPNGDESKKANPSHQGEGFQTAGHRSKHGGVFFGVFLVLAGVLALFGSMWQGISWWNFWPLFIVAGGVVQMFSPDDKGPWRPWRIVDGLVTIGVGLVFLGCTTGFISWNIFWRFITLWPLLVVAAGLSIIGHGMKQRWVSTIGGLVVAATFFLAALLSYTGATLPGNFDRLIPFGQKIEQYLDRETNADMLGTSGSESESVGNFTSGSFDFVGGAGSFNVDSTSGNDLYVVSSTYPEETTVKSEGGGTRATIKVDTRQSNDVTASLSRDVTWDLKLESGASDNTYNLRDLKISSVAVKTGASNTVLTLGEPINRSEVSIDSGFAAAKIRVPRDVPVKVIASTGLSSKNFGSEMTKMSDGSYQNDAYKNASSMASVWEISLRGGLADFSLEFE